MKLLNAALVIALFSIGSAALADTTRDFDCKGSNNSQSATLNVTPGGSSFVYLNKSTRAQATYKFPEFAEGAMTFEGKIGSRTSNASFSETFLQMQPGGGTLNVDSETFECSEVTGK